MRLEFPAYAIVLLVTAGLGFGIAAIAWSRRDTPGSRSFAWLMLAAMIWMLARAFEAAAISIPDKFLWHRIQYLGVPFVGPLWLVFALGYTRNHHWLKRRNLILLFAIPVVSMILALTNEVHSLIWTSISWSSDVPGLLVYAHGPLYWLMVAGNYLGIAGGTLWVVRAVVRFPHLYRRQAVSLLLGAFIPVVANLVYLFGLSPVHGLDLTPFGFGVSGIILAWSIFRFRFLHLVPIAREALIENMDDGVIVLDAKGRVADINPMACSLFGFERFLPLGWPLDKISPALACYQEAEETRDQITIQGDTIHHLDLHITPLCDEDGHIYGRLIVLHDNTAQKDTLQQVERLYQSEQRRVSELSAVRSIAINLLSEFELTRLLHTIVQHAITLLQANSGELALFDLEQQDLEIVVNSGMGGDHAGGRMILGEGIMGRVALTRQPLLVEDYLKWEGRSPQYLDVGHATTLGVPLLAGPELLGVIAVGGLREEKTFSPAEIELLQLFAQEAALAIRNARLFEQLRELATRDTLTGLYNRRHFFMLAAAEVERSQRYATPLTAIMLDLDGFKKVNDTYGHASGDAVLRQVAQGCQQIMRRVDIVGRYGGEEFSIILPETDLAAALIAAERLRALIASTNFETPRGRVLLSASLGVAELDRTNPNLDALIDSADQALYEAKQRRNQVRMFQPTSQN